MHKITEKDINILARTIYGEDRGELNHPKGGMQSLHAVGWVVRNRTQMPQYSKHIHEVCTQSWQFSCWNCNDPNYLKLQAVTFDNQAFRSCYLAATQVLFANIKDCTFGANHYHSTGIAPPYWAKGNTPTTQIGQHIFYKLGA